MFKGIRGLKRRPALLPEVRLHGAYEYTAPHLQMQGCGRSSRSRPARSSPAASCRSRYLAAFAISSKCAKGHSACSSAAIWTASTRPRLSFATKSAKRWRPNELAYTMLSA